MNESAIAENSLPSQPANTPAPSSAPAAPAPEKMIPQSQFNEIIGPAKRESYEKGRRDAQAEWQQQQPQPQSAPAQPVTNPQQPQALTLAQQEELRKIAIEEFQSQQKQLQEAEQKRYYQAEANKIEADIMTNLKETQNRYEDFNSVVTQDDLMNMAEILLTAHQTDPKSVGDVVYHICKNPTTLGSVNTNLMKAQIEAAKGNNLGYKYYQQKAADQINLISSSVKTNQDAVKNQPHVNAPLSQVQSSNIGMDNGKMSVEDYKNLDWLRG